MKLFKTNLLKILLGHLGICAKSAVTGKNIKRYWYTILVVESTMKIT